MSWTRRAHAAGRTSVTLLLTIALCITGTIPAVRTVEAAADPVTQVLADGLETVALAIGAASALEELAEAVPLTGVAPALADGVNVLQSLHDTLASLNDAASTFVEQAPADVEDELEDLDDTVAGVTVTFGCDAGCDGGETPVAVATSADVTTITLPIRLSRDITVPLAFESDVVEIDGGTVDVSLFASTTLSLTFNAATATTLPAQSLRVMPFQVTVGAQLVGGSITASTRFGIADATASLDGLSVDLGLTQSFSDPDGVGGITVEELANTTIADLGTVTRTGSVEGTVSFDTDLIDGSPDVANIDIGDTDLSDGYSFSLPSLTDLDPFTLISPEALIAGLGQSAAALGGAQAATDPALPFIGGTIRRLTAASRPVLDVVDSLGVICGVDDAGGTPSGSVQNLTVGTTVYCQAVVTTGVQGSTVVWTSDSGATAGANTSGPTADPTVGVTPTANATFVTTAPGDFEAHVTYTATFDDDGDGVVDSTQANRRSEQPPRTVQALVAQIALLGGFDDPTEILAYDPDTKAMTFHLSKTFDGASVDLPFEFGDQLESQTGIVGLTSAGGGLSASASNITVDITPGVLLLPPDEWGTIGGPGDCPDPSLTEEQIAAGECVSPIDLFFVQLDPAAPEFAVEDASFSFTSPQLVGSLGYLGIQAQVDEFTLGRVNAQENLVELDLVSAGDMTVGGTPLPNAVRLRELLFEIGDRVDVSPLNLGLSGSLTVSATLNGSEVASAGVDVDWSPVGTGSPTITPSADFDGLFEHFNPVPNLFGSHSGADSTTTLDSPTASFGDAVQGVQVDNLTDGSSCSVASFTATTLTCADPLAGGTDNRWEAGDLYRVHAGSALAMLEVLLDNIDQITTTLENLTGIDAAAALDTELPIVGVSPRELLQQISDLRRTLAELRGTGAKVQCGLQHTGGSLTGDPSQVVLGPDGKGQVYCNVVTLKPVVIDDDNPAPVWSVSPLRATPGTSAELTAPGDVATTIGTAPTDVVTIEFVGTPGATVLQRQDVVQPDGTTVDTGFEVNAAWNDIDGRHAEEYPSKAQPGTIQALERAIQEKLGISEGFGLDIVAGPEPGQQLVTIDLNILRCNSDALCGSGNSNMGELTTTINADIDGLGGLVSAGSGGQLSVTYSAGARITLGLDLSGTPNVYVMPTTGIALKGRFEGTGLDFDATLGPFSLKAGLSANVDDTDPENPVPVGAGEVRFGADLTIGSFPGDAPVALGTFLGSLGTYLTPTFVGGPDVTCGTITIDETTDPVDTEDLGGLGCGRLSIGIAAGAVTNYVADLGFEVTLDNGDFEITPFIPQDLLDQLAAEALDLRLILNALPPLIGQLKDGLRAGAAAATGNGKIPFVGDTLDAGADIAGKLQEYTEDLVQAIDPIVAALSAPEDIPAALQQLVWDELGGTEFLLAPDGSIPDGPEDIEAFVDCGNGFDDGCTATDTFIDLVDVRVVFGVGKTFETNLPFDLGLDGVPLRLVGGIAPSVTFLFVVDVGLSRTGGPYIGVTPATDSGSTRPDQELGLVANIGIGENDSACSAALDDPLTPLSNEPGSIIDGTYAEHRCLGGQLSFLGVQVRDGDNPAANQPDSQSHATINLGLDLSNGDEDRLGFTNVGDVQLEPVVGVETALNLRFRTGIVGGQDAGFPEVVGTFHFGWEWNPGEPVSAPTVGFDDIHLNLQPLLGAFIEPISNEVRKITGPFKPVIDTLTAPIPVVSDLAEMVGQPPVTLLGLMQLISGNDLTLIQSLAAFISFINDPKVAEGYIPLGGALGAGSFSINPSGVRLPQGPTDAGKLIQGAKAAATSLLSTPPVNPNGTPNTSSNLGTKAAAPNAPTKANLPGTFGVPGLTFPFIENPSQIFNLLMGQDITLVRYDIGPLQATAGFSYNFPPILVGPVPIAIGVGGSVTVKGRFVIGYDTSGLRKVLAGGSGMYLFDGIFLDDLDINGVDVPEISFIGEVYAQAGVSVGIASAGIVAGLRITVDLNLDDSPDPDGKLHIEEIFNKLANPICLFDVSGSLTAFIKAYLELNLFITSLRFDFTLLEMELLNFSGKCTPPKPQLASLDASGNLTLNIGPLAGNRNVDEENKDEEVTVRPASADGRYSVSAFGVYQTYGPGGEFPGPAVVKVIGNGANGKDKLLMLPGSAEQDPGAGGDTDTSIPFAAALDLQGGPDDDVIQGGDAVDTLDGGPGNDRVQGGKGGDHLIGGDGDDTLNGEDGGDDIDGNGGNDKIQGGAGDDDGDGGPGFDLLQGGPGTSGAATDGNDTLAGGDDGDTVEGGSGDDDLFGDEAITGFDAATCDADTAYNPADPNTAADKLSGGTGTDELAGGAGPDEMYGGGGNDTMCGNQGDDLMDGDQAGDPQAGTPGDDIVRGGSNSDGIVGGDGNDLVVGGAHTDSVDGGRGNDDVAGGAGRDLLLGGEGRDIMVGDQAAIDQSAAKAGRGLPAASVSLVSGEGTTADATSAKCALANDRANQSDADSTDTGTSDCLHGGDGEDLVYGEGGNDQVYAGTGNDLVFAGAGDDDPVRGEAGDDTLHGGAGMDRMYGDSGRDTMFGNADADQMRGGIDDDHMQGNGGTDTMYGEGGQDDIIGGTSADGAADAGDVIDGGVGADVIVGDNGVITRPGGDDPDDSTSRRRDVTVHDVGDAGVGGGDTVRGDLGNDQVWGGNAGDDLFGDSGIDRIEGNDGADEISGGTDDDRLVGGSSARASLLGVDGTTPVPYDRAPDTGDTIDGDQGADVLAGDDATIAIDGVATMTVFDTAASHGDDLLRGGTGDDRIYGQLGADDVQGGADHDYGIGDLGAITPGVATGLWPSGAPKYEVRLQLAPDSGGADAIDGGSEADHLFGGAAGDTMRGQSGDDYMEGNGGQDSMYGWTAGQEGIGVGDQDDMIGGSSDWTRPGAVARADVGETVMQGNADHDVMTGDNATIDRITDGTAWAPDEVIAGARKRVVTLLDRATVGVDLAAVSGDDVMLGNTGSDRMYGEGGDDSVKGNDEDDLIEGNQDDDWLEGNAGEDDVIGGSSQAASIGGAPLDGAAPDLGDPDGTDAVFGGSGADVLAGDNARIVRRTAANSAAYAAALPTAYMTTDPADARPGWWIGVTTDRLVVLLDRGALHSGRFGSDLVAGGGGADVAFGQDGNDWVGGGANDDTLEGNGGTDTLVGDDAPTFPTGTGQPALATPPAPPSSDAERDGTATSAGEDDLVGGSNVSHRDVADSVFGNGEDDFVLGDNGTLRRNVVAGAYAAYPGDGARDRLQRQATRLDVNAGGGVSGGDTVRGNAGDDAVWGQDGSDAIYGGAGDDDLLGEVGGDAIYGGTGEDAIVGDRGGIRNTVLGSTGAQFGAVPYTFTANGPPFLSYTGFRVGTYDRRVDLTRELPGSVGGPFPGQSPLALSATGIAVGGNDLVRGGPGHDSVHGASGDDLLNGDSGGDIVFGGDGSDVMWGGRGNPSAAAPNDRGPNDSFVDYLFGGRGGATSNPVTGGADIIDYLPRPTDPAAWSTAVADFDDGEGSSEPGLRQHHQGVDWIFGGLGRDVMEADLADNGPNFGDRLIDWTGAFNLYVHCPAAYGGYNDVRVQSPQMIDFEERLAFSLGVGESIIEVRAPSSSAYNELAMIYKADVKSNSGSAYPTTPGHFDEPAACSPN